MEPDEYIADRLEKQREWHSRKSSLNQKHYITCTIIQLAITASIPIVNYFSPQSLPGLIVTILGSLSASITSFTVIKKYHENWISYRQVSESLKRELMHFKTNTGSYADSTDPFSMLVDRTEQILATQNSLWIERQTSQNHINHSTNV